MRRMLRFGAGSVCVEVRFRACSPWRLVLTLLALLAVNRAFAQLEPAAPAEYELEVGAALDDHEAGRFEAARVHFLRAHTVFPNARTLRGLGKVEFELRHYVDALRYLEAALVSEERPLPPDLRDEVGALIERARDFVGELVVDIKPETAELFVDGSAVEVGPRVRLVLEEGSHVLDARASGRLNQRRQIDVHGRDQLQFSMELLAVEPPSFAKQSLQPATQPEHVQLRHKWWVWAVSGAALAGAVTAAVLLSTRDREHTLPVPPGASWTVAAP